MKYVVYAIVLALSVPLYSQEIRLDSLWIKMGGYPVMAFSPDSKFLLLGQADGIVNIVEVEIGTAVDTITLPKNGYADFGFTPDGKYLVVSERKKITLFSAVTWDSLRESPAILSTGYISFSNDSKYVAVADRATISILDLTENKVVAEITRPTEFQTKSYFNGRVNFNSDGTLLYGKNAEDFGSWDLTKANTPFVRKMTIGNRAVIGFTPDNRYMVQQSNYIWDLNTKAQVQIEGKKDFYGDFGVGFTTTASAHTIVVLQEHPKPLVRYVPQFIDLKKKKIITTNSLDYYATHLLLSPDSNYLARIQGPGAFMLNKVRWNITNIIDNNDKPFMDVLIYPSPTISKLLIRIYSPKILNHTAIDVYNAQGEYINTVFAGKIDEGNNEISIDTNNYPSGSYSLRFNYEKSIFTYPFIINK